MHISAETLEYMGEYIPSISVKRQAHRTLDQAKFITLGALTRDHGFKVLAWTLTLSLGAHLV